MVKPVAAMLIELLVPVQTVMEEGCVVTTGSAPTVNNAADVVTVGPQILLILHLYLLLCMLDGNDIRLRLSVVAPAYTAPLVMSLNVVPPSVLTCHWYVRLEPVPLDLKYALVLAHTIVSDGDEATAGGTNTVNVALLVNAGG